MLRKNTTYKGKRSTDILKVKQMFDDEYVVVDLENDYHRVIVGGKEIEEMMLKNVIIEHKGNRVQVGSGFNHEQRRHYFENPDEILGKRQNSDSSKNKPSYPSIIGIDESIKIFESLYDKAISELSQLSVDAEPLRLITKKLMSRSY